MASESEEGARARVGAQRGWDVWRTVRRSVTAWRGESDTLGGAHKHLFHTHVPGSRLLFCTPYPIHPFYNSPLRKTFLSSFLRWRFSTSPTSPSPKPWALSVISLCLPRRCVVTKNWSLGLKFPKTTHLVFESSEGLSQTWAYKSLRTSQILSWTYPVHKTCGAPISHVETEGKVFSHQHSRGDDTSLTVSHRLGVKGRTAGARGWGSEDVCAGHHGTRQPRGLALVI